MGKLVDYMLIVGGFGASPYLIAKLRDAFSHQVDEVVCPGVPSQAVLKGGGSLLHMPYAECMSGFETATKYRSGVFHLCI